MGNQLNTIQSDTIRDRVSLIGQGGASQDMELELLDYIRIIWRRKWLILLLVLIAGSAAYVLSKMSDRVYEARSKVLVEDRQSDLVSALSNIGGMPKNMVANYVEILKSRSLLQTALAEMGLPPHQAPGTISIQPVQGTDTIEIRVQSTDPAQAQKLANTMVSCFIERNLQQLQADILASQAGRVALSKKINELDRKLAALPVDSAESEQLSKEKAANEALYALLITKKSEMEISEQMRSASVSLVDPAYLPTSPIKPNTKMNIAVGIFLALFGGAGLAFLFEYLDPSIKSREEAEQLLGLPILGMIPYDQIFADQKKRLKRRRRHHPGRSAAGGGLQI